MSIAETGRATFVRDERGSSAIMFALLAVPIFGVAGAAIDFARGWSARSELQVAADAAALAAASADSRTTSERIDIAAKVFEANAGARAGSGATKSITLTPLPDALQSGMTFKPKRATLTN